MLNNWIKSLQYYLGLKYQIINDNSINTFFMVNFKFITSLIK